MGSVMEVRWGPAGASSVEGDVLFIDLLRLSTTLVTMFAQGVEEVYVAETPEEAVRIYEERGLDWLFGERGGQRIRGFHFGNSPTEVLNLDLRGARVVITTSNGTPTLLSLRVPARIGALVNASSAADFVASSARPVFVLAGEKGGPADEDLAAAEFIYLLSRGETPDYDEFARRVLSSRHAKRLVELGSIDDVQFSLSLNLFPHLPHYDPADRVVRKGPPSP